MTIVGPRKITIGFVTQIYDPNTGLLLEQAFTASDQEEWENEYGESIEEPTNIHDFPLEMTQPPEAFKAQAFVGFHNGSWSEYEIEMPAVSRDEWEIAALPLVQEQMHSMDREQIAFIKIVRKD